MHGLETIEYLNNLEIEKNKEAVSKIYLGTKENGKIKHFQIYYKKMILNTLKECNIDGATIYKACGIWKGEKEKTLIVEIVGNIEKINKFASILKNKAHQESVLIIREKKLINFMGE